MGIMVTDLFCAALTTVCELVLPLILRYITNVGMKDLSALTVKTVVMIGAMYFCRGLWMVWQVFTWHIPGM